MDKRAAVIAEARTWLGTPWAHQQRLKGVGTDCAQWVDAVYGAVLGWPRHDFGNYAKGWMLHGDREIYLEWASSLAERIEAPQPGDFALFKWGRCYSHGAIVLEWPTVTHADSRARRVVEANALQAPLAARPVLFFDPFSVPK